MPFEVAPEVEQQTREQLGRIALARIADHIENIPDDRFDMHVWRQEFPECGTIGCAIGHSRYLPEVVQTGLRFDVGGMPVCDGLTGTEAVAAQFGMPFGAAIGLFGATEENRYRTAPQVAARIRAYLKRTA